MFFACACARERGSAFLSGAGHGWLKQPMYTMNETVRLQGSLPRSPTTVA